VLAAGATSATIGTGLTIPATNGVLHLSYDTANAIGATDGPETISYTSYTTGTGALAGLVRGLAGTTDVQHSNGQSVQSTLSSLHLNGISNAWIAFPTTCSYASATTFTTGTDLSAVLTKGDKIWFTQTTEKYYYVVSVSGTTVTVTGGSDYTIANAAITAAYYSKGDTPSGFPDTHTWTPTHTRSGGAYTNAPANVRDEFSIKGSRCFVNVGLTQNGTPGSSGQMRWTTPVTPAYSAQTISGFKASDNTTMTGYSNVAGYFECYLYTGGDGLTAGASYYYNGSFDF
jgi:hypothetical protein